MEKFDDFFLLLLFIPFLCLLGIKYLSRQRDKLKYPVELYTLAKQTTWVLLLASTTLLCGEIYYRFFMDTANATRIHKNYEEWVAHHFAPKDLEVHKTQDFQHEIPQGKRRITIIGDAFIDGYGINHPHKLFPNILRNRNPDWQVHTFSNHDQESIDQLVLLNRLIRNGYELDIVVLMYSIDDIAYLNPHAQKLYKKTLRSQNDLNYFTRNSLFLNALHVRWQAFSKGYARKYRNAIGKSYSRGEWKRHISILKKIRKEVHNRGEKLLVVNFPFLDESLSDYPYTHIHQQLEEFWTYQKVPYFDLLPVFQENSQADLTLSSWDFHPNERANTLAAEALGEYMTQLLSAKTE